jgi:hypothetical protein
MQICLGVDEAPADETPVGETQNELISRDKIRNIVASGVFAGALLGLTAIANEKGAGRACVDTPETHIRIP